MTLPIVELSKDEARQEALSFLSRAQGMTPNGQVTLLAAILQRIYQQGVCAADDMTAAIMKGAR